MVCPYLVQNLNLWLIRSMHIFLYDQTLAILIYELHTQDWKWNFVHEYSLSCKCWQLLLTKAAVVSMSTLSFKHLLLHCTGGQIFHPIPYDIMISVQQCRPQATNLNAKLHILDNWQKAQLYTYTADRRSQQVIMKTPGNVLQLETLLIYYSCMFY